MAKDKYDVLGPLLNDVGQVLADVVGGDPNGVFFYVEIGPGWVSENIFKDDGAVVRNYRPPARALSDLLFELWYAESDDEAKRWSVMEYIVKDGRFAVEFKYPDEVDVSGAPDDDRRQAALRKHFGDKQVIYPPLEGMVELKR